MTEPEEVEVEETETEETETDSQTDRTDWKREAQKWERRAKSNVAATKELAELKKAQADANRSEVDKAREEGRAEANAAVLKDRALDRVETRAAKAFADPEDARALLASKVDDFIDNGQVDNDAIDKALAALLKSKPHLGGDTRRFKGGADGGARDGGAERKLTADDVRRLFAEGKHAEIEKARVEGRIDYESQRKR